MIPLPFPMPWRLVGTLLAAVGLLGAGAYAEHWRAGRAAAIAQAAELAQKLEAQQEAQRINDAARRHELVTIDIFSAPAP